MKIFNLLLESRLDFLKTKYTNIPESIFNQIVDSDPTNNKIYTQWLLNLYSNKQLKTEDLYKATNYLNIFTKFKNKLPLQQRNIANFKSLPELYLAVKQFEEQKTQNELDKDQKSAIYKQIKVIYNGPNGKILIPLTQKASCFLGQNTQWCTVATKSKNYFNDYNKKGPLYVIILSNGERYQFHLQSGQLMNVNDSEVNFQEFDKKYPWVFEVLSNTFSEEEQLAAVKEDTWSIRYLKNPSEELQLAAVSQHGYAIAYIKNPSETVQLAAVKRHGGAIKYINNPSEAVQLVAVKQDGHAIDFINNPSEAVQLAAVNQNGYSIRWINNPSEEVQLAAVKQSIFAIEFIKNPSKKVKQAAR